MKCLVIFVLLYSKLYQYSEGKYVNNSCPSKNEANPVLQAESIWEQLLEEWVTENHREKRVMQLPLTEDGTEKTVDSSENKSKISGGKIIVTTANKKSPGRDVSETDLYLLGAIEKLVYRVDFMEKRLRRVEEMLYYAMAGIKVYQEPCPHNFARIRTNCYLFLNMAGRELDWKASSKQCKKYGAVLAEMETIEENQDVVSYIKKTPPYQGKDYWVGGLNPGLLWIWSNSARPVSSSGKNSSSIISGDGHCLRIAYDQTTDSYIYRGSECYNRYNYICEYLINTATNELRRLGRSKNIIDEF